MKKSWTIIATYIFLSFSLSAKEVRVYNWSDYIDQSVIDQFDESTLETMDNLRSTIDPVGFFLGGSVGYAVPRDKILMSWPAIATFAMVKLCFYQDFVILFGGVDNKRIQKE